MHGAPGTHEDNAVRLSSGVRGPALRCSDLGRKQAFTFRTLLVGLDYGEIVRKLNMHDATINLSRSRMCSYRALGGRALRSLSASPIHQPYGPILLSALAGAAGKQI